MRSLLEDAVAELGLEPGQSHTETVGDRVLKVSVETAKAVREEEPSQFADMVMLDPWFTIPDSAASPIQVKVVFEPDWPAPYRIDDSDLAPE